VEETKKSSPDEERTAKVEELANGTWPKSEFCQYGLV
jgi:hypothetical protein